MIVIIAILLVTVLNQAGARAGVAIEQRVTTSDAGAKSFVINRKLMLQDDKEEFAISDWVSIVIDADAGTVTALDHKRKVFRELPLQRIIGTNADPNRLLYLLFKSTEKTRQLLGFKCRDSSAVMYSGPLMTTTTACLSTDATGSDEFSHFLKSMIQRGLGHRARAVSVPAGVPLIIESTNGANPSFTFPDVSQEELLKFKNRIAKIITREEVTKITSEKISPDVFTIPAGYTRQGPGV